MLKKGLYERYVPDTLLAENEAGRLLKGHDDILKRDVLLYVWKEQEKKPFIHSTSVLQIMDSGRTNDEQYVVLEYVRGVLLGQVVAERRFSLKEALGIILQVVTILLQLTQNNVRGIALSSDNFWLTQAGQLKLINTWDRYSESGNEINALFRLMHELVFGRVELDLPIPHMIEEISLSYPGDPFVLRKSLSAIWKRADKRVQSDFESYLRKTKQDLTSLYQYIKKTQVENSQPVSRKLIKEGINTERTSIEGNRRRWWALPEKKRSRLILTLLAFLCIGGFIIFQNRAAQSKIPEKQGANAPAQAGQPLSKTVPDVTGMTLEEAQNELDKQGIRYQYFLESSFRAKGTVIRQSPEANTSITVTDMVTLWVSG
ncbi:Stk1 family PASTA domain-containing Ser/Thr kinase [Aneurinibacillus terranovensis]|uniref:Stk1 family PASTA domain-containing Ser/Thr kinase n=1 Tax=Aneurinibacillus terranovensis TaxID=278991 RepID=UPI00041678FE|nr:Stk1 family PASTA domain-containing Ser/Thr kinase [Aneurinibacillus terranovensis]